MKHWTVTVTIDGEEVVTIDLDHVAGRELDPEEEEIVRLAAKHLLGFIGEEAE